MTRVGFEPTISEGERPKTYALDRAATGTGICWYIIQINVKGIEVLTPVLLKIRVSWDGKLCR